MRKIAIALCLIILTGCSTGARFPALIDDGMQTLFPDMEEGKKVKVVYPVQASSAAESQMVHAYGPAWEEVRDIHPEYLF